MHNLAPDIKPGWDETANLVKWFPAWHYYVYYHQQSGKYILYIPGDLIEQHDSIESVQSSMEDLSGEKLYL